MRYTRPIVILTLILLLAGSLCYAQCGNKNYNSPCGINFHAPAGSELTTLINEVQACGIGWIRVDFDWNAIEPSQNNFSWGRWDAIVAAANARGILVFGTIGYSPAWATSGPVGVGHPNNPADWYDICYRAAERYDGKHGKGLVSYWGMWNEPNLADFYAGTRSQYINEILINGYNAVKAANPDAKVCGPELAHMKGSGRDWFSWMKDCIEQAGDYIDVLTHHTYGSSYSKVRDRMDKSTTFGGTPSLWGVVEPSIKEVLQYCNWFSTGKPFWHTEVGWQSRDVGETNQANYYNDYLNDWFTGNPNRSWVNRVFFYEMFDHYVWPDLSWGIISLNNGGTVTRKPAFTTYKNFITAHPPAPIAPCKAVTISPVNNATGVSVKPTLTWTPGEGANSHKVYFGTTNPPPYVGYGSNNAYSPGTLQPLTTYYWRIDAINTVGTAQGDVQKFTTMWADVIPPSVPGNVQAVAQSSTSVQITWSASTDNEGVAGYKIYRNGVEIGTTAALSFVDGTVQPETTYTYTVAAYDAGGNYSAASAPAVVTTPPDTEAPSVPGNLIATAQSMTSVLLNWNVSTDNVGVTGYRVYRDGVAIGTNAWNNYTDNDLNPGETRTYTVTAYDAAGNESAQSDPAVVTTPSVPDFCSVDLGSTDVNSYMSRVAYSDGATGGVMAGGLNCRQPTNVNNQYFYFAIDDSYIFNGSVETTYLEVCYFDDLSGAAFIEPQYDSASGEYTSLTPVALTGSGKWKTATWTLNDCLFANRQNGGADFRLYVGQNSVKIDSVRVSKIPFSEHTSVERDLGINEMYQGLSNPQYTDGNTIVQLKDGVYCKRSSTAGNNYFYFNVSDAVIWDGSSPTVTLKVTYYDSPGGLITPEYDSESDEYTAASTLTFEGTNTWKENVWKLENVKFANRQNASADFRLYVGTAQNVYIDTVVVSKSSSEDNEPPSVPQNVSAVGLSPSVIKVSWSESTDNVEVTGYRVFRDGVEIDDVSSASYTDSGLTADTTYSYTVSAFDANGNLSDESSPAAVASTMTALELPAVKELQDETSVGLQSQIVTAVFDGYIYVSASERYAGIRVVPIEMPDGIAVGMRVDIGGTLTIVDGERQITDATVTVAQELAAT